MVTESAKITLFRSIDEFAFCQRHEVEVLDALLIISDHPLSESRLVNDLPYILKDEIARLKIRVCPQAKPLFISFDDRDVGVLFSLKTLVLAITATIAFLIHTFHLGGAVDARIIHTCVVDTIVCQFEMLAISLHPTSGSTSERG